MMNTKLDIKIEVTDNSPEVLSALKKGIARALWAIGAAAEGHAKEYETRVDTGRLRNSITHEEGENYTAIGTNVEYAAAHELGTSRGISPLHYLRKAASNHTKEYEGIVKNSLLNVGHEPGGRDIIGTEADLCGKSSGVQFAEKRSARSGTAF